MMENQLVQIMQQLKYYNIKWIKSGSYIKFQMRNKKNKVVATLRFYADENFNPKSPFYSTTEQIVNTLKSDYNYVTSYRVDCQ